MSEESKWISVKDKLPPYDVETLCCNEKHSFMPVVERRKGSDDWYWYGFTHWMPLPAPPAPPAPQKLREENEDE